MPTTIYDIAKEAACSPATVSKVFNNYPYISDATRVRVMNAARTLGYMPNYFAKSLITKRSYLIGAVIYDEWNSGLTHPLFGGVLEGFKRSVEAAGYEILLIKNDCLSGETNFIEHCRQRGIEGVFVVIANTLLNSLMELIDSDIPCVSTDVYHERMPSVLTDNRQGGYLATRHLIEQGHTRIAHIAGNQGKPAGAERLAGYQEAMLEAGLPLDDDAVVITESYGVTDGEDAMAELLRRGKSFSAVFAASDMIAYGAAAVCRKQCLCVPEDVSFIGFDDIASASLFDPPLTTMRQDQFALGQRTGEMMVGLIEKTGCLPHAYIPAQLIVRNSVASRPAACESCAPTP